MGKGGKQNKRLKTVRPRSDSIRQESPIVLSHICDSVRYRFFEMLDSRTGGGVFEEGYAKLTAREEGWCDERLRYLRNQPEQSWDEPHAKRLNHKHDGDCEGIYEIRFKAGRVQQRPMGYFGVGREQFTIVLWATHKDSHWIPSNFCEVARKRWDAVRGGSCELREIEIDEA